MTTVVAIARDGAVAMAADRMSHLYDRPVPGATKIRRHTIKGEDLGTRGELLLAFAGDASLTRLTARHLTVDGAPDADATVDARTEWACAVAEAVTEIAREAGVTDNGRLDGNGILAHDGHVWTIAHAMALHHDDGIAAIGSGEGPAIGAVDAMLGAIDRNPTLADLEALARLGVLTAIKRDTYSGGEPLVLTLGQTTRRVSSWQS